MTHNIPSTPPTAGHIPHAHSGCGVQRASREAPIVQANVTGQANHGHAGRTAGPNSRTK